MRRRTPHQARRCAGALVSAGWALVVAAVAILNAWSPKEPAVSSEESSHGWAGSCARAFANASAYGGIWAHSSWM
eukprot:333951-Pleurochrysis_carterae.AAC.1